jgi:hypothetical protein
MALTRNHVFIFFCVCCDLIMFPAIVDHQICPRLDRLSIPQRHLGIIRLSDSRHVIRFPLAPLNPMALATFRAGSSNFGILHLISLSLPLNPSLDLPMLPRRSLEAPTLLFGSRLYI